MNDPIMLTPHDIFNMILAICGAIITISAAITIIVKAVDKAKAPDKLQDQRITDLEEIVKKINSRLDQGDRHFDMDTQRVNNLEEAMRKSNKVIIESLQALTAHAIDGNNIDELKSAKRALEQYLIEK